MINYAANLPRFSIIWINEIVAVAVVVAWVHVSVTVWAVTEGSKLSENNDGASVAPRIQPVAEDAQQKDELGARAT